MRLFRHVARLAAITTLLGGAAVLAAAASPAASAASVTGASPAGTQDGWVRIAHLSPKAPAMDMYLYPFGDPGDMVVLKDVSYGDVSAYQALSPGEYTVAMRGFGAPESSKPALTTSFAKSRAADVTILVKCIERVTRLRDEIERADVAELSTLLGRRISTVASGNVELDAAIRSRRLDDQRLIQFLGRRAYRLEWLYSPVTQLYPDRQWAPL